MGSVKTMKIAILGTRGIPNHYGGFEQLAEQLSVALVGAGHEVTVYNSSLHPYQNREYKGVKIVHCKDPENKLGSVGQFIYDFFCIRHIQKTKPDVVLQLGYTSSSVWNWLIPSGVRIVTNMDGLEWMRAKYSKPVKQFLKFAERWAVDSSHILVADSPAIGSYLNQKYSKQSRYIAYSAEPFENPDREVLLRYGLEEGDYFLAIARFEPENNLEMLLKGYEHSGTKFPLVIIGSTAGRYGRYLVNRYSMEGVKFAGPVYSLSELNNLRFFSRLYFHGHSVGGTNPSLLEAMASYALIAAHDNPFNKGVLGEDALYYSSENDIMRIMQQPVNAEAEVIRMRNVAKIRTHYSGKAIFEAYEKVLFDSLQMK